MLMLSATKSYLCSAFLTWAEIKTTKETPSYVKETMKTDASTSADEHWQFLQGYLGKFVDEFVPTKFDIERKWEEENERKRKEREAEQVTRSELLHVAPARSENLFPPGKYKIFSLILKHCI